MASKFKIFCDEQPDEKRPLASLKQVDVKREPLGLRQAAGQAIESVTASSAATSQQQPATLPPTTNTNNTLANTTTNTTDEEDQENDISMASLGSDFVPSILHDNDYDDDDEEEEDDAEEEVAGIDDDGENSFEIDDDEDFEADEELKLELSRAFREHDESQLFKSASFIDDIKSYLFKLEREADLRPLPNYMEFQSDIDAKKRAILIKWLVEVSDEYELQSETLFISIAIIDRFLSRMSIPTCNFQLLGVAAMFIASKYEEIYPPNLYQFIELTEDTYSGSQIRQMEQEILKALDFRIAVPTITYFLRQIFAFNKFSRKVYDLAEYLCYLSLVVDQPFLEYYPSEIALAAVILAAYELDSKASISTDLWNSYDKSNTDQLRRRELPNTNNNNNNNNSNTNDKNSKSNRKTESSSQDIDRRVFILDNNLPLCIESLLALQKRAHTKLSIAVEDSSIALDDSIIQRFLLPAHNGVALLTPPENEEFLLSHK